MAWTILSSMGILTACNNQGEPAPLPGRWSLVTEHIINTDATTGQILLEYDKAGTAGDYLKISATTFEEYRDNRLSFSIPYTYSNPIITLQGPIPRMDRSLQVRQLTNRKLVLHYQLPAIVLNQQVTIDPTYSR